MYKHLLWVFLLTVLIADCTPYIKHTPGNISDLQRVDLHQGENTLPSGRKIVVNNVSRTDFDSGEPSALVLNYTTSVSIDNMAELRAEVDEVWPLFVKNVEAANLTTAALRPVNGPKGYGFVVLQTDDGKWHFLDDEKK